MQHPPLTDLYRNHIRFTVAGEPSGIKKIFAGFGVNQPEVTDRAAELRDLYDQVTEFAKPYRAVTTDNLAAQFHDTTPDKWEDLLDTAAMQHVKAEIVHEIFPNWRTSLRDEIKAADKDAEAYADTIAALPLAETITTMTNAAKTLNGTHHNASAAIDIDPVAYKTFRDAGRNLNLLSHLLSFGELNYDPGHTPELLIALYANPGDLPTLTASPTKRLGVHVTHYTDADLATHDQVVEARALIAMRRKEHLFLAELAAGRWPALTFDIAPTIPELQRRAAIIAGAGIIDDL